MAPVKELPKGVYWKRGELWVFVGRQGRQFHRPAHTTSVKAALEVRDGLLKEILAGEKTVAGVGNVTCGQLLTNYLERLRRKSREGTATYKDTKGVVERHLIPVFGKMKASRVNRAMLEKYRDNKIADKLVQVTVNRQLGYLRTALRQGKRDGLVNQLPDFSTSIIASAESENARTGIITEEQYKVLLDHIDNGFFRALFVLCWNTGVRPKEAFRLTWDQVDWKTRLISVKANQAKIGVARYLPMRKNVVEELELWRSYLLDLHPKAKYIFTHPLRGNQMTRNDYRMPWANACKNVGYAVEAMTSTGKKYIKPTIMFYDTRRAFRTYMPEEINDSDGKKAMGQTQDTTYGRYHVEPQRAATRLLKALEKSGKAGPAEDQTERLKALKNWFDSGLIDEEEYKEHKRLVISGSLNL